MKPLAIQVPVSAYKHLLTESTEAINVMGNTGGSTKCWRSQHFAKLAGSKAAGSKATPAASKQH